MDYSGRTAHDAQEIAAHLLDRLRTKQWQLVLAESCTSGLGAGILGSIPGASNLFCGSMVVYQIETKHAWLGLDMQSLQSPEVGAVSAITSRRLAEKVLQSTPQAHLAAAITGHLGPGAEESLDGQIFIALRSRLSNLPPIDWSTQLRSPCPISSRDWEARRQRQLEAVLWLYDRLLEWLSD